VALKDILIRDEIIDGKVVYDMIKMWDTSRYEHRSSTIR
jgi:hypothetical protein